MTEKLPALVAKSATYVTLIGIDFGDAGEYAFREALGLLRSRGDVDLHVAHVISHGEGAARKSKRLSEDADLLERVPAQLREYIRDHGSSLRGQRWESEVALHVRIGDPAEALVQLSIDIGADVIIVGRPHARSRARRLLGTVVDDLLEKARCPVLVAGPKDYEGARRTPTVEPPRPASSGSDEPRDFSSSELFSFGGRTSHISGLL